MITKKHCLNAVIKFPLRLDYRIFYFFFNFFFFSFYHNKIHPVTNYKAIKNKINKTRQHRTKIFFNNQNNNNNNNKNSIKENEMKLLAPAPLPFHFERSINQSYDQ